MRAHPSRCRTVRPRASGPDASSGARGRAGHAFASIAIVAVSVAVGCGSTESDDGGAGGSTASSTSSTGGDGGSTAAGGSGGASCDAPAFVAVAEDAGPYMGAFVYLAQDTLGTPVDVLTFELLGGSPTVGSLAVSDAGYDSCQNCVLLYRDCDENLANCAETLMAQAGSIEVTASGSTGDTFAGTLRDAAFVEVTIDGSGVTTPVAGGEQFCQAPYAFSAVIQ